MKRNVLPDLIDRYLNNKCTEEEKRLLEDWYASREEDPDPLVLLSDKQQSELKQRMLNRLRGTLRSRQETENKSFIRRMPLSKLLAAASVVVVFSFLFYFIRGKVYEHQASGSVVTSLTKNASGTLKRKMLPDGSNVWLKPSSKIKYVYNDKNNTREVWMTGECFFDVKHDALHPFIIHAGDLHTRVLGTSFNIKAYANAPTEVSVVSGKVYVYRAVSNQVHSKGVILLPQHRASYSLGTGKITQKEGLSEDLTIWEKRSISFENETIENVAKILERKFHVRIIIPDPEIRAYTIKADFTNQNLPAILEMMSRSLEVKCEIIGDRVIIENNSPSTY